MPQPHLKPGRGFLNGTRLLTLAGELPVEQVAAELQVLTLSGEGPPLQPVLGLRAGRLDERGEAVRIAAGAIDDGAPIRDLLALPEQGVGLDDSFGRRRVVPARLLVNGATIRREPAQWADFMQVALEAHELVMADGMPAESCPTGEERLVVLGEAELALAHARLLERATQLGWRLTADPGLTMLADGAAIRPAPRGSSMDNGILAFAIPPRHHELRLLSRCFVPNHTDRDGGDERRLGVAVEHLVHDGEELDLAGPACGSGFLPLEGAPPRRWRWTTGEATLHLPCRDRPTVLEIRVARGWSRYWLDPGA